MWSAASSLVALEIRHVFISSSHPLQVPSFHFHARGGKQGEVEREGEREKERGGMCVYGCVRMRVSVCTFKSVCVNVCLLACCVQQI